MSIGAQGWGHAQGLLEPLLYDRWIDRASWTEASCLLLWQPLLPSHGLVQHGQCQCPSLKRQWKVSQKGRVTLTDLVQVSPGYQRRAQSFFSAVAISSWAFHAQCWPGAAGLLLSPAILSSDQKFAQHPGIQAAHRCIWIYLLVLWPRRVFFSSEGEEVVSLAVSSAPERTWVRQK